MKSSLRLLTFLSLAASAHAVSVTWDTANANNNWNTTDLNWTGGVAFANGNDAVFDAATGETVLIDAGGVAPASTSVSSAGNWTFAIGSISGTLAKSGAGTLTLSNSNSFSSSSLTGGSLTIGNVGALGSGVLTVGSGAKARPPKAAWEAAEAREISCFYPASRVHRHFRTRSPCRTTPPLRIAKSPSKAAPEPPTVRTPTTSPA